MRRSSTVAGLSVSALLVGALAAPPAMAGGGDPRDNLVVSLASEDGDRVVERSSVVVTTARGRTVDNENVARAEARDCTGCRAIAVAFQAVLVPKDPSTVAPGNAAVALNDQNCSFCTSAAFAYQYVVQTDGVRKLSRDGQRRVDRVARKVDRLTRSGLSPEKMDAGLDELEAEFRAAVDAGLTKSRGRSDKDDHDADESS